MAEEFANLVGVLFDDKAAISSSSNDIGLRSQKLGLQNLYLILKQGVEVNSDGKLGLQHWDQAQIQSVVSVAYAIVSSSRTISVELVEPIVVAVMEQSLEFALCCLEKSVATTDDLSFIQLLEIALVDGTVKEADMSHSSVNLIIESLKSIAFRNENVELQDHIECMVQGSSCSKAKKPVDRLLMTLASEWTHHDNMNAWAIGRTSHDFNKLVPLLQHWAVHLGCIQRLVSYCLGLVENLDKYDEKIDGINLRKRLSFCTRVFKLLASVTKDAPYVEYDAKLLGSFASFTNGLPSLFRGGYDFATGNVSAEFSIESLSLLLLEAFLHLVHTVFCNTNVFQNILVCVIVSVFENLDADVWRYDKSITNVKLPMAYFPRIVLYILKLVEDVKKQQYQALELNGLHAGSSDVQIDPFLCGVGSGRISLLKKYTVEELLKVIFPTSKQWVDNLMHLAFFLHSEGVKILPKLDRSYSSCTKGSSTLEPESTVCHEDDALFGDLFSEGGRSVGSTDGYDQSIIAASSVTNVNMPLHAATEVFLFLKTSAFSTEWHSSIYEDAHKKLTSYHIDIMLSVLSCQGCHTGERVSDAGDRKFLHTHEVCYEVLYNLISSHTLSNSLEEYLVSKILTVENGSFVYNHQTLALLAHTLICRVGSSGNHLRTKVQKVFVEFVFDKVKSICACGLSLKELIESLPSIFHIEILLMSFHLSSEKDKAVQANFILSSIKTTRPLSKGSNSTQLSCWGLLVSRLVLILRHMIFYPKVCPPTLLSELKSKLREAPLARSVPSGNVSNRSFWASTSLENVMRIFITEGEVGSTFLNQLIDVTSFTASACKEDIAVECLGLNWAEVRSSFSWILEFWRGIGASAMEDLVLERYIFMLCWDIPRIHTTLDFIPSCSDLQTIDITSIEHFLYFGHSILGSCGIATGDNFSKLLVCVLEQLQSMPTSEESAELGWDFLRSGSWLSLVLSLLGAGIQRYCISNEISSVGLVVLEHTSRDVEFLVLAEKLVVSALNADTVAVLLRALSVILRRYRNVYQKTLLSTFGDDLSSANKFSPLLLLKHTGFDKSLQDVLSEKFAFSPCQLESICEILLKLDASVDKMAPGVWNKVFLELIMHGFPCSNQVPSGFLFSCILSIKGIICALDGLLKVINAKEILSVEVQVRSEILESILSVKSDKIFCNLHGQCDAIYDSLSEGLKGFDYRSFFIVKNMYDFLRDINARSVVDSSVNECVVSKAVDIIEGIMKDPLRASVLKSFMSNDDVSEQTEDTSSSQHGDLLVLIDALENCNSEPVNVKVLSFFVDLLSGDMSPKFKLKLQKKFLDMNLLRLSKWLEKRLLGSPSEPSCNLICVNGSSLSLKESTMKFIVSLVSPPEIQSEELHFHIYEALVVSLDNAFMLYDVNTAKSYLNFVVQLSSGEASIKPLLERTVMLMKKLACDERLLQGLKYLFSFLGSMVSDFGSSKSTASKLVEKSSHRGGIGIGAMPSRSVGSSKHPDPLILSSNQEGGSASLDCDATSADEDEDDGTSDGEVASMDKDEFDDSTSERALASKVCTFTSSGSNFMEQHWYFCYTCDLTISKGCCSVCAKVCHRGHRVVYSRSSRFFCDCGAGGVRGSSCQCLKPRKFTGGNNTPTHNAGNLHSFLPFTEEGDQLPDSESDVDEDGSLDMDNSVRLSFSKEVQEAMPSLIKGLDVEDRVLEVCLSLLPAITSRRDSNLSKDKNISIGEDKVLSFSADLLQLKKAYKSGSLDLKIKADYTNARELKSHLASGSLVKSLLSVSTRGRLAVGEGDKVAIFDVGQLIGQATIAPVTADKANVKPLSKNVVRFEIVHLAFNPLVENYLAVAGYEDCQVLTVSHRGEVTDRLAIELALQGAYIRRVEWVPGSQVQLMVVTNKFVKIYDLSQDNISPMHYITLPDDTIVDATLAVVSQAKVFLLVLSELGCLFRLELSNEGNAGAKTLKEIVETPGRETHVKGSSLYFSSTYKLLIASYQDGTTLVGRLSHGALSLSEISAVYEDEQDGKLRPAGLHRFKELLAGSGLFVCFSSVKSNAALTVSVGEHEIRAQNMRNGVYSTSLLVGITAYKPLSKDKIHCLVLHDDGSLQIYTHVPVGVEAGANVIPEKVKKLGSDILNSKAYASLKPEFPLDFFEKTVCITADVKLSGDVIRNGDSEGAKQSLASEDGFLESPTPAGFKVTISNSNPDIVMVGFRVHVGNTSANHIPSDITIFQRVIKLDEGMRSWYDIPFTVAESLLADEEITISIGPTFNRSTLPRIDTLEIYGRAKDEFGWKEKMDAVLDMEARVLGSSSWVAGSGKKRHAGQAAPIKEQVVADGLNLLSRLYAFSKPQGSSNAEEVKTELSKLKCKNLLEIIFESDREPLLQAAACRVLQAVFPKKELYYQVKDTMRLLGVVSSTSTLSSRLGIGGSTSGWIIEEFTAQMHAVSKIALHRRFNLASFLAVHGSEVVDGLMQVLWGILDIEQPETQTMNNIVIASVDLIYSYAECLVSHEKDAGGDTVAPAVSLFKKLLFSQNEAVQTSSSLAISSRLLQVPFPKQTMLGTDDTVDSTTSAPARSDVASSTGGIARIMVEEDSITSSVQYCCDGCSTVPILRRRWHCTVCPDFDLCEACYEMLDADRLPPPHSRDHPMSAIPIEVETYGGEGDEMQFSTDDLSDPVLQPVASNASMPNSAPAIHVLETTESGDFPSSVTDPVTISASKRVINSLILSEFLKHLKGWMGTTSGVRAIPVMQLFYRLSSAVGGPFVDSSRPESLDLEKLIKWFLDEISVNKPFTAKTRSSFGEVTILVFMFFTLMLRNWHQPGGDGSIPKPGGSTDSHEKNISQISPSPATPSTVDDQEKNSFHSQLLRACGSLRQQDVINYLMDILQQLMHVFKSPSVGFDSSHGANSGSGCGALLTVRREIPAGNFSPFFSDSYAKSHRSDMFADYHRLLLENTFRLVYSLVRPEKHDKAAEKEKFFKNLSAKDLKLDGYQDVLCSYINNSNTTFVRRYARRLFLHLCGSKTHYYSIRDSWQFSSEVKKLYKHINKSGGFQSTLSYERSVKIVKCLSTMAEVSSSRPRNWQKYCLRHGDVLRFLVNGVFYFPEECVSQALKLLNLSFYNGKDISLSLQKGEGGDTVTGTSSSKPGPQSFDSKKKKKGEDGMESGLDKSFMDMEPMVDIFSDKGYDVLRQFVDCFLLEWNSSSVRVEAKCVLYGAWHHGKQLFKETMLTILLEKIKFLPMYGQNIMEYTELVTCLLGRIPDNNTKQQSNEIVDRSLTCDVIQCIYDTLHLQNELLANHPNSRIYNTLSGLVEFDGYYLESEPCVACSCPELPYSRMKLESLKSETKFTDNRIIVKCTGSYTIQSVTMNVHDARKSKSVKVLNLYYNNRPVTDLAELKNNWSLWKRAKICQLAFNQTELKVDFPIPITACNFMIELDSFYENLQALSLEPLQCPRCSRPVTDRHGICSNCHENAYQCRQCRNINYENLDSFLCNECGYSKYGRFEFNFMAKPSFTFDNMENDDDMKRGLAAIESESENAHRRYQQLLGFKKPLLKIVSSIGENDTDSQQKDSVQQMMVSLPGPSCKINRKIALLGVLYGEKCKAAFDSVSKSVQTLQGLRRVLMSYLHQKHSDGSVTSSRLVVSRSPNSCYGCATVFVTQCLEMLQVLSKHPSSKKQLVSAGILSELFENNIHQGPKTARVQARAALCAFSEGDKNAVSELNSLIQKKVMYCLEHHRSMDIALATREELLLLSEVCSLADEFWESRLRVVFQLLFSSIKLGAKHPSISEHVILPCLRIISQACTPPKSDSSDKEQGGKPQKDENSLNLSRSSSVVSGSKSAPEASKKNWDNSQKTHDIQLLSYSEWEKGASYLDFVRRHKVSQTSRAGQMSRPQRFEFLALKYALRWKRRACKTSKSEIASFELGSWVTELVLSACSQSIRSEMCMLISLLCAQGSSRRFRLLNLLMSLLPATLSAGENAAEYFDLLFKMIETEDARIFLTVRGCLTTICKLITQEVSNVESLERSLRIDISQGFILHKLIELLGKFLDVPNIRSRFMREQLLSEVLEALIVIRGLIVQKTKLISDCSRLLKDLLDSLLLESAENKKHFIQACIGGLQIHGDEKRGRSNLFILEQLCNLICPSKPEAVYHLILNKAHTQEEFIRGSMTKNPYSSSEIGPLMRDVKNKICNQLDLLGLIEDDYGMELLVAGNIISLDLSIAQVYEQVWKKSSSQSTNAVAAATLLSSGAASSARDFPPMTVTYRLQGLDGEATEPMIKELDEDREESQDPEVEFAIAGAVRECGGLEVLLEIVQRLRDDLKSNQEQLVAVLNLLMHCCKIRENRRALLRLGGLSLLLEIARRAFSVDAIEPAEGILLIVESLTMEANESDNVNITQNALIVSNEEAGAGEQAKKIVLMFLERLSHPPGLKKSNKQQRNTEMVARILPYLTYGEPAAMEALVQHFYPYLKNWVDFDQLQKQHLENPKDESVSLQASKQRFAVENFVRVSESMKTSSCGERLKDIILETGITEVAVRHLKESFASMGEPGFKSTPEWVSGLKLPSVSLILSMLRGLSMGHLATQKCVDEGGLLPLLHALESVSGENDIGARAENLLDTLSDKEGKGDGFLADKVDGLRHATRDEMRRRALMKRNEMLEKLGWHQESSSDGGKRIVVSQPLLEGLEEMEEEEEGLACMVCREGYSLRPTDLLGVYTFSKRVNLGVGTSGSARGDCVYTTVSHFNIIHFQCHQEAKRADAALKTPKKEWDGAALRNNETLCNNLYPIRGPAVPLPQYTRYVDQYWDYLNSLGRADGSRLRLLTYDIVLMLARFATGASFSIDARGGGKESNAKFLPFMIQMARYFVDHDSSQRNNLAKSVGAYLTSSTSTSTPDSKSPTSSSAGTEETVQFMMVSSLLSESYESWLQHRRAFLQRGIYHAYMQRTHASSSHRSSPSTPTKSDAKPEELLTIIQSMLVYTGLIQQLQHYFKVPKKGATVNKDGKNLENWEAVMKEKLVNVKDMAGFSKEMLSWLDDMTSATDLQEAFDVIGVLADVMSTPSGKCEDFVYAAIEAGKG